MARPVRSIDVFLPLDFNDGRPIAESKFLAVQQELLERFGGVTSVQRQFPQFEVLRYLERLKTRLKRKFDQLEILITVQELLAV